MGFAALIRAKLAFYDKQDKISDLICEYESRSPFRAV